MDIRKSHGAPWPEAVSQRANAADGLARHIACRSRRCWKNTCSAAGAVTSALGLVMMVVLMEITVGQANSSAQISDASTTSPQPTLPSFSTEDQCWKAAARVEGRQVGVTAVCVQNTTGEWELKL